MLFSLSLIFFFGLFFSKILSYFKIPDVVSMIFAGIMLNYFDLLDFSLINISSELRQIALVIILTRAGLSLNFSQLKSVGKPVIFLSFLPALFEIFAITFFATLIFKMPVLSAVIMGCVVSAVSPAIIVPRMINLQETGFGMQKKIPDLILAGASIDDIFVIVLFYTFLNFDATNLILMPINLIFGVIFGLITSIILSFLIKNFKTNTNTSTILFLSSSFFLLKLEEILPFSALLSIMVAGMFFRQTNYDLSKKLSEKYSSLWSASMIILFVLVGASLNLDYLFSFGLKPVFLVLFCLFFRILGTYISLSGTNLNKNERFFCAIAYLPKATVQAGIGAIPLSYGVEFGELILTVSIISIIITAPLGAFLIDNLYEKLLQKE